MSSVLIVEDEQHLADGLRFNLEAEGYDAEVVGDGETALEHLTTQPTRYDAVVLDVMLPGIDGTGRLFKPLVDALPRQLRASVVAYPAE